MERNTSSSPEDSMTFDMLGLDPGVETDRWIIDEAHQDPYMAWLLMCKEDFMSADSQSEAVTLSQQKQRERTLRTLAEEITRRETRLGIRQIPE